MYLMYVDESGDTGLGRSPTRFFALSGIIVHETKWRDFLNALVSFRKTLRNVYGLPLRTEIHSSVFVNGKVQAVGRAAISRPDRLAILRNTIDELAKLNFLSITNVIVDKDGKSATYDVFEMAWSTLFQRFENTLTHGNFPSGFNNDYGMVITDATAGTKLMRMVRRMAVYNYVPHDPRFGPGGRNIPIVRVIEDPHGKDSRDTLPLQMCDVAAYFLHQRYMPNAYVRAQRAQHYFDRLKPVLNTHASRANPLGIVRL